jgi:hypothetical protein
MGDILSSELVKVIYALLPGFITAWIFYGLTAHRRLSPFERTVQALIFTGIIQAIVLVIRGFLLFSGKFYSFGEWTENLAFVIAIVLAIIIGIVFSLFANKDWFHKFLRYVKITKRTSFPSEWFSAFNEDQREIVLHLKGDRRLRGWPREWPDHPDSGHFVIEEPEWLSDEGESVSLNMIKKMLISAKDVEMVEFMVDEAEIMSNE